MDDILYLQPVFQERIWGGETLQSWFPTFEALKGKRIGECWAISAHPHGESIITTGSYAGMKLRTVFAQHPELFGLSQATEFPLLVKILDAQAALSVQVHPDDAYAAKSVGGLGKTECWYVLACDPDATLIYGHTARTKAELSAMIAAGEWDDLLIEVPVKQGDFFYVPSGTIHALQGGTLILEVQQSSDMTFRLYDYERCDENGTPRELHIAESIAVTRVPHQTPAISPQIEQLVGAACTTCIASDFFTVKKLAVHTTYTYTREGNYMLATIITGTGTVNGQPVTRGTSFIVPCTVSHVTFEGAMEVILAYV